MRSSVLIASLIAFGAGVALTGCYSRTVEERPVVVQAPAQPSRTVVVTPSEAPPSVQVVPAPR